MVRRVFLGLVAAGGGGYAWFSTRLYDRGRQISDKVSIVEFGENGERGELVEVATVRHTEAEWKKLLPLDSFMVTRRKDTEFAFTGALHNFYGVGLYRCVACGTGVFESSAKYASGTGWPAFTEPAAKENVVEFADISFGLPQTEVRCARCWAHLGHLFDDGPPPGGLRYCINSVALRFSAKNIT